MIITFVATIPLSVLLGIFTRIPTAQAIVRALVMIAIDAGLGFSLSIRISSTRTSAIFEYVCCLFARTRPLPPHRSPPL
jgi:hypothetical protein